MDYENALVLVHTRVYRYPQVDDITAWYCNYIYLLQYSEYKIIQKHVQY